jgi:spermidine/putrescine transport system substrate-binding protein
MSMDRKIDPALLRGLSQRRYDRRDVMKLFGVGAGLGAAGLTLAACGVKGAKQAPADQDAVAKYWADKKQNGHLDIATWALYMPKDQAPLKAFTKETGITVNYQEVIQDDPSWYGKIQPQLAADKPIGYDLMVVTNGMELDKLVEFGYLAPLDHSRLPNYTQNADPIYRNEAYDKGNVYSIPYTSGYTGIAYNPAYVKEPITKIAQLWDPKYAGKIGMMKDPQELGNFGMLLLGINPETSTPADWTRAAAKLREQKPLVRAYVAQDYTKSLANGDLWICQGWSGDIFQENASNGSNLQFVVPEEGGTIWTDNMMIPKTAANPVDAMMMMDYFYRPQVAADLTEFINYVTPVPSTKNLIAKHAAASTGDDKKTLEAILTSPLVYPTAADLAKLKRYPSLKSADEQKTYQNTFLPISSG